MNNSTNKCSSPFAPQGFLTRWFYPSFLVIMASFTPILIADTPETEPNDDAFSAQDLDGQFLTAADPDIGDSLSNTSTTIPHVTIIGDGAGPLSNDWYKFTVPGPGRGIFDIDYGNVDFHPDRFGIATQTDGTIWIKDDKNFYFLDENMHPQWGFKANYSGTIHNILAVRESNGLFYSVNRGSNSLVRIDPDTAIGQTIGPIDVSNISALAFNNEDRLFAITGRGGTDSFLYELNPNTGAVISSIGDTETSSITGLDFNPQTNELFALANEQRLNLNNTLAIDSSGSMFSVHRVWDGDQYTSTLYQLDPLTAENVRIGPTGLGDIAAIAFNAADQLYATTGSQGSASSLYRLDPSTGDVLVTVGDTGVQGMVGIDFEPGSDTLFGFANGPANNSLSSMLAARSDGTLFTVQENSSFSTLYTVDPVTELLSYVGEIPLENVRAIEFDASDRLFAVNFEYFDNQNSESLLHEINPADGSLISTIGPTGFRQINSLAFNPANGDLLAHADFVEYYGTRNSLASDLNGTLYSFDLNTGELVTIDATTQIVSPVGPTGLNRISALAFDSTDRLFAISGTSQAPSILYELNPATGALISTIGATGVDGMVGLDFHPGTGVLYGHSNKQRSNLNNTLAVDGSGKIYTKQPYDDTLFTFDPADGLLTAVGVITVGDVVALAFDASGRLFATTGSNGSPSNLYELDPLSGVHISTIGATGFNGVTGLGFHPTTGVLYGHSQNPGRLITIDKLSGIGTQIGESGVSGNVADLTFDPATGILYGAHRGDNDVYTFDLSSGIGTRLGEFGNYMQQVGLTSDGADLYVKVGSDLFTVNTTPGPNLGKGTFKTMLRQPGMLYTLNKTSGEATPVAETNSPSNMPDMSFEPATSRLYSWSGTINDLTEINIVTGEVTVVGEAVNGVSQTGLAFSRSAGTLFMKGETRFHTVDTTSGLATIAGFLTSQEPFLLRLNKSTGAGMVIGPSLTTLTGYNDGKFSDFTFDTNSSGGNPYYGTLYGYHRGDSGIYTFDLGTGKASLLGQPGSSCCTVGLAHDGTDFWIKNDWDFSTLDQSDGSGTFSFTAMQDASLVSVLYTINLSDAVSSAVGQTGVDHMADLTFDEAGNLYGWDGNERDLHVINTLTGVASRIGESGTNDGGTGLAYDDTSDTLYMKARETLYTVNPIDGSAAFLAEFQGPQLRLLTLDITTAQTTDIGPSWASDDQIPDISFTADGRLYGFENDDSDTLIQFDLSSGKASSLWGYFPHDVGIDFSSDGTLWVKDDDDGLYTMSRSTAQGSFATNILNLNQNNVLAINSSDVLYTHDNYDHILSTLDSATGETTILGTTQDSLSALAFDATNQLFGITGLNGDPSILYRINPTDGSTISTIGNTGYNGIEAMSFHPVSGQIYAHTSQGGLLLMIDPSNASVTPIGPTGAEEMDDFAFAPDQQLFGWAMMATDESDVETLVKIDTGTGATTPVGRYGDVATTLTLYASDGTTVLASNSSADYLLGEYGSTPPDWGTLEPFFEYNFPQSGTYFVKVSSSSPAGIPLGGTYELQVSVEGKGEVIFSDGFEGVP